MKQHTRTKVGCSGAVLVELILSIPLLIGIPLAFIELSRYLQFAQIANVMSQESAFAAYRNCADEFAFTQSGNDIAFDPVKARARTQTCLDLQLARMQAELTALLPGAQLVLSVYRYNLDPDTTSPTNETFERAAVAPAQITGNPLTKYSVNGLAIDRVPPTTPPTQEEMVEAARVKERQRLIVAEVLYTYTPILTLIPLLNINVAGLQEPYRETTIL